MTESSTVSQKSRQFAVRIVRLYQYLCEEKKEYVLSKQLLRSGTSIGANIAESTCAFSQREFLAKMYIAFKECSETLYWISLLHDDGNRHSKTAAVKGPVADVLMEHIKPLKNAGKLGVRSEELGVILISGIKTSRHNIYFWSFLRVVFVIEASILRNSSQSNWTDSYSLSVR